MGAGEPRGEPRSAGFRVSSEEVVAEAETLFIIRFSASFYSSCVRSGDGPEYPILSSQLSYSKEQHLIEV